MFPVFRYSLFRSPLYKSGLRFTKVYTLLSQFSIENFPMRNFTESQSRLIHKNKTDESKLKFCAVSKSKYTFAISPKIDCNFFNRLSQLQTPTLRRPSRLKLRERLTQRAEGHLLSSPSSISWTQVGQHFTEYYILCLRNNT